MKRKNGPTPSPEKTRAEELSGVLDRITFQSEESGFTVARLQGDGSEQQFDDITIFETEDGKARVEVRFEHDNVWLTQKLMAELSECSSDNISLHLKNIFKEGELQADLVTEDSSVTAADRKNIKGNQG